MEPRGRDADNHRRLGACGGCEAVVAALQQHKADRAVALRACWAVLNLASTDAGTHAKLKAVGAAAALRQVCDAHGGSDAAAKAREALSKLGE